MYGMPAGFAELLQRKYDILQQQADTQKLGVAAAANLDNTKAGLLPNQALIENARTAQETANLKETQGTIKPLAEANIRLMGDQGLNLRAEAANTGERTFGMRQINQPLGSRSFRGFGLLGQLLGN